MGWIKISILLFLLGTAAVNGRNIEPNPIGPTFAMEQGHAAIGLAAEGRVDSADVTKAVHAGAVVASTGDTLSTLRLGAGLGGRKMLGEAAHVPSDADLMSTVSGMAAQSAVQEAVGNTKAHIATGKGHVAVEHATIADSYDAWKTMSGYDKRRLGEKAANLEPGTMSTFAGQTTRAAILAATEGTISPAHAAHAGVESGMIGAVEASRLDSLYHLASGEYPEGPMTRPETKEQPL